MSKLNTYIFIFILTGCSILATTPAKAEKDEKAENTLHIDCTYYVPDPKDKEKYHKVIQWPMVNAAEWDKLQGALNVATPIEGRPRLVTDGKNPVIHIVQRNDDLVTGEDIYISPNSIIKINNDPSNAYATTDYRFRSFLEKEMKLHAGFGDGTEKLDVTKPGIVVRYNASGGSMVQSPHWNVSEAIDIAPYIVFVKKAVRLTESQEFAESRDPSYKDPDTFTIYLNVPNAPARYVTVTTEGHMRMTSVVSTPSNYRDDLDLFTYYKKQAQDVIEAKKNAGNVTEDKGMVF